MTARAKLDDKTVALLPVATWTYWHFPNHRSTTRIRAQSPLNHLAATDGGNTSVHIHVDVFTQKIDRPVQEQKASATGVIAAEVGHSMWSTLGARPRVEKCSSGQRVKRTRDWLLVDGFHRTAPVAGVAKAGSAE